jgi:acetyl esterase/lipase
MLRWSLLLFALLATGLGALTTVQSPDWSNWKLALLAGEYGHWLVLLPTVTGTVAWFTRGSHGAFGMATAAVCAVAAALLLKPAMQAWRIGRELPAGLERSFGRVELARPPFSFGALLEGGPAPVSFETIAYSDGLKLDFYRAVLREGKPAPCVLVVHGGGWDGGERGEFPSFNQWLAGRGYAVAAISYRLAPKFTWPAQRDDLLAAIAWLKAHASALGFDPTRLVLFGRSAGGNLVEATAYADSDPAIRGVIAFYAPADLKFAYSFGREDDVLKSPLLLRQFLGGPPETAPAAYDSASGYLHVGRTTPPTLLMHGSLDPLVWHRQSERLDQRLAEAGVPHAFISLPWATHAFEYNLNGPGGQLATYAVEWFLAAVTR